MELVLIDENISGAASILKQAREQRRALASQRRQHQAGKATAAVTGEEKQAVSTLQRQAWEGPISHAVVRHAFAGGGDRALAVKVGNMVRVLAATPGSDWWLCRLVDRERQDGERHIDDDGQMGWVPAACMQSVGSFPLH